MVFASRNISRAFYAVIALVVFAGDQVTKRIIESSIPERGTVTVIPGLFSLTNVKNVGAAFGLFADSPAAWKTGLLILASAGLLGAVASIVWRNPKLSWKAGVGLSLIMGGAAVISVLTEGDSMSSVVSDHVIEIPASSDLLSPILSVIPLQLLAYHIAVRRGCDVDQPRNLAKSVTVE